MAFVPATQYAMRMNIDQVLQDMSLPVLYVISVVVVLGAVLTGFFIGDLRRRRVARGSDVAVGSYVASILSLLAFVLAFTFAMAVSRFDARKQLLLDEVNVIGTAYLRADFLDEPQRIESRQLLKQYVDQRVEFMRQKTEVPEALNQAEGLHSLLWDQVKSQLQVHGDSISVGLYIQSLNEVIDIHGKRVVVGLQYHIPEIIWLTLIVVTLFAMTAVGYQFGLSGTRSWVVIILLALSFSAIALLIAALDSTSRGSPIVNQQPLFDLQDKLNR